MIDYLTFLHFKGFVLFCFFWKICFHTIRRPNVHLMFVFGLQVSRWICEILGGQGSRVKLSVTVSTDVGDSYCCYLHIQIEAHVMRRENMRTCVKLCQTPHLWSCYAVLYFVSSSSTFKIYSKPSLICLLLWLKSVAITLHLIL